MENLSKIYVNPLGELCYSDGKSTMIGLTLSYEVHGSSQGLWKGVSWGISTLSNYSSNWYYHRYLGNRFGIYLGEYISGMYSRNFYQEMIMEAMEIEGMND